MKYIIDVDALKSCLELIDSQCGINGSDLVRIDDVKEFIDRFPKDVLDPGVIDC